MFEYIAGRGFNPMKSDGFADRHGTRGTPPSQVEAVGQPRQAPAGIRFMSNLNRTLDSATTTKG